MDDDHLKRLVDYLLHSDGLEVERLDVEIKAIEHLNAKGPYMATIAKAVMALGNHGGGSIVTGFIRKADGKYEEQEVAPEVWESWEQTRLHDALARFIDPVPEVKLAIMEGKLSKHPCILIPPHGKVPFVCNFNGDGLSVGRVYIRKPGPKSEEPSSASEWEPLLRRCLLSDKDDLVIAMRNIIQPPPTVSEGVEIADKFREKIQSADRRFEELLAKADSPVAKKQFGRLVVAYQLLPTGSPISLRSLRDAIHQSQIRASGWPFWMVQDGSDADPRPKGQALESFAISSGIWNGVDYWYAEPTGFFYATRALMEDMDDRFPASPPSLLEWNWPIKEIGEVILHATKVATYLGITAEQIRLFVQYKGLEGRVLWNASPTRIAGPFRRYQCHISEWSRYVEIPMPVSHETLPETVRSILGPLYEQFDLFEMPVHAYVRELATLTRRSG